MSDERLIEIGPCCKCKTNFSLPEPLYLAAKNSEQITFYCPYGHPQVFRAGESEEAKQRRRANLLQQQLAQRDDEIINLERSVSAHKGQATKLKNRAKAGVCPCCNRTFQNLARHMKSKHGDLDNAPAFKVIEGKKTA